MAGTGVVTVYGNGTIAETPKQSPFSVKVGLAQMLRGGHVIMDVVTPDQARISEEAGAGAVMALERVPTADQGNQAGGHDPRDGQGANRPLHGGADPRGHRNRLPLVSVCGCRDLGEALRRIRESEAMIRTKGEAGTGNVVEAVRHVRSVMGDMRVLRNMDDDEVFAFAKEIRAPYDLVAQTKQLGRLPVAQFVAGGVSGDPTRRARAIVQAVTHYSDPAVVADVSCGLGEAMVGINLNDPKVERYATRSE
ncbi:pyridoxine biosynthesis protein [Salvia divinorum]|uniref:pyridoxal 5'-phosphate synthase (glutamine hydrolyzing) n=1 Tax=Salvia divinorum TaxID=28513 RepID=A0ABD1GBF8_SALDI